MIDASRRAAADLLWNAEHDRTPVAPLTETFPGMDVVDAYEIQLRNIRRRVAGGASVRGHKVGLSSEVMQRMMGVDEPDYGHLLSDMVLSEQTPVDTARYCCPRIEVEIGYVLGEALSGENCTEKDVIAATEYIVPSIELIDSRITDWRIALEDTIADNASSAGLVLGAARVSPAIWIRRVSAPCCTGAVRRSRAATPARCWAIRPSPSRGWPGRWRPSGSVLRPGMWCCPARARRPSTCGRGTTSARSSTGSARCRSASRERGGPAGPDHSAGRTGKLKQNSY